MNNLRNYKNAYTQLVYFKGITAVYYGKQMHLNIVFLYYLYIKITLNFCY